MVLSKAVLIFFCLNMIAQGKSTNAKLPILITKQDINNIRFISHDGKYTYYQKRSGSLLLATNYNVSEVLKGKLGTNYEIYASPTRKKMIVTKNENYHTFFSPRAAKSIYLLNFGKKKPLYVGEGVDPKLHLNDTWMSFYNPYKRIITLSKTDNPQVNFKINISNQINPYFVPKVVMANPSTVFFTDINPKGYPGLIRHKKDISKSDIIHKIPSKNKKIEICKRNKKLVVGEFALDRVDRSSMIFTVPLSSPNISKMKIIYKSKKIDIGNMVCSIQGNDIFFIGDNSPTSKKQKYEVLKLDIESTKLTPISDISYAGQIIDMDSKLLLPFQGKYHVLLGDSDVNKYDLLKKQEDK